MIDFNPRETGGGALVIGYLLVLLVLYRNPASGLEAATVNPQSVLYFVVLPVVGLLAGIYASVGGPYGAVPLFVLGSYLGIFGLALTLGYLLAPTPMGLPLVVGIVLLPLSIVALVASVLQLVASLRSGPPRTPSD